MPFCKNCGNEVTENQAVCLKCGCAIQPIQPAETPANGSQTNGTHNKVLAALLAIFIGGLGIHKFYLGKPLQGVLYILFCWTFIPAIVALIEGIVYLTMTDQAFAEKYH